MNVAELALPLLAVTAAQIVRWGVWAGLVALTAMLLVLARTRWGQSQPIGKCIVLSLLAHVLLALYATTVGIMTGGGGSGPGGNDIVVAISDDSNVDSGEGGEAWDRLPGESSDGDIGPVPDEQPAATADLPPTERAPGVAPELPAQTPTPADSDAADKPIGPAAAKPAEPIETQPAARNDQPADDVPPPPTDTPSDGGESEAPLEPVRIGQLPTDAAGDIGPLDPRNDETVSHGNTARIGPGGVRPAPAAGVDDDDRTGTGGNAAGGGNAAAPPVLAGRTAKDRGGVARRNGGSADTEAAVEASLRWLAANQHSDGRWNARGLEGGRGAVIDGQDRRGVGAQADTGLTGLALLAFLAAGHTHERGAHAKNVQHGLEYLINVQAADGNLFGSATLYEKMYCHAMAAFALSEAYAMSRDDRLKPAVAAAVRYSTGAQHRAGGGWRYQPDNPGDTSQLGWQVMFLKSAELAGGSVGSATRSGIDRFLVSVSSGEHGGLASYRPGHAISRAMTAEALVCRQFLGMRRDHPAVNEATAFLLEELPGAGETNHYYWYYGTLAMFQAQGEPWEKWNDAMQRTLLGSQRRGGDLAGSWDPDLTWGRCGGRVYSTSLCALCLEVYYRYLPLYVEAASTERNSR